MKELIRKYGKAKINTLTKFPSILTFHQLGERGTLLDTFTTDLQDEELTASEKVDGTNSRIICYGGEFLIGARENILHHSDDLYFDVAQGIVEGLRDLNIHKPHTDKLTAIYGEFYGGKTSANSKWYGKDKIGYRVFAIAVYDDLSILDKPLDEISRWREHQTDKGIIYGQKFLSRSEMIEQFPYYEYVPLIDFDLSDTSHVGILENMKKAIPESMVVLSDSGSKKVEGLVLSNANRTKVVKIRFEDYEKTLRKK